MIHTKLSKGLIAGLVGLIGLLVVNAGLSYGNIRRLNEDESRVARSLEVMDHLEATLGHLREAEAIHRAYLLVDAAIALAAVGLLTWLVVRHLRDQRRAAASVAALEEAGRRKDEFLATLAHELRNPLAPIRTAVDVLRMIEPHNAEVEEFRDMIERQVMHMVRLIDDLLEVSRIARGHIDLRRERLDLARVLHDAIETSRPLIDAGRHELVVSLPSRPVPVDGDPVRLTQVVTNVLNNAAKFTPDGGRIEVAIEPQGREAIIRVADNGPGIPANMLPRVFELFTQVHATRRRSQGGLGIGLGLVKRLVEIHGGTVEARSGPPGDGAEFLIRLPMSPADATELERIEPDGDPARDVHCVTHCTAVSRPSLRATHHGRQAVRSQA